MKLEVWMLEQQVTQRRLHSPFVVAALNHQPDMGKWSQEGRLDFLEQIIGGMSQQLSWMAYIDGVKIFCDH